MDRYFIGDYYIPDGMKPLKTKVKMPIEWLVLEEREDGKSLLLSRNVLDWEAYGYDGEISWHESFIYKYLGELYESFFSGEEKSIIVPGELGPLFLLSKAEIEKYLPSEKQRRAVMYYVDQKVNGEIETSIEHHAYWLRADEADEWTDVPCVMPLGDFEAGNCESDEMGIRAAMWVDTEQAGIITAEKGYNPWHHDWDASEF